MSYIPMTYEEALARQAWEERNQTQILAKRFNQITRKQQSLLLEPMLGKPVKAKRRRKAKNETQINNRNWVRQRRQGYNE